MKLTKKLIRIALVGILAVVLTSVIAFVVAFSSNYENPFALMFVIITLGVGLVLAILGAIVKGGYEMALGSIFLLIGAIILMAMLKVNWVIILVVAIAIAIIEFIAVLILCSNFILVKRADEEQNFVPYMDKLKEEKLKEEQEEKEIPTLKSFKD